MNTTLFFIGVAISIIAFVVFKKPTKKTKIQKSEQVHTEHKENEHDHGSESNSSTVIPYLIAVIIILVLLGIGGYYLFRTDYTEEYDLKKGDVIGFCVKENWSYKCYNNKEIFILDSDTVINGRPFVSKNGKNHIIKALENQKITIKFSKP